MPRRTRSRLAKLREHNHRTRWRDTQAVEAYYTLILHEKPGKAASLVDLDKYLKTYYTPEFVLDHAFREHPFLAFLTPRETKLKRFDMSKIVDEDVIRNKPVSQAYRDGWERCFGEKSLPVTSEAVEEVATDPDAFAQPLDTSGDAIVCTIKSYANYVAPVAIATIPEPEPTYPCDGCGKPRTKAEGGTTFTVCDECWKHDRACEKLCTEGAACNCGADE